ncbi:hypothetical protein PS1_034921 [Malus domestica]
MSLSNTSKKWVFVITFQTIQNDSTGMANIVQQSVIYGSRKYPLKRPFDELVLKSFSTYMYCKVMADRTYYSGNCTTTKELHNFVNLLLDAVFFPNCVEDIQIFWQQGLRYELNDPSEDLSYQGIVFNQMKEFQFWPLARDVLKRTARQAAFPDSTYNFDHAGDPQIMPQLTFEDFKVCCFR